MRVGLRDVHAIKTTTDMFAALDDSYGGGHARTALIQYLNTDVARLLTGRYTEAVGRALFSTVAEATMLAGWMSYDAGHHGAAQRYYVQALRLAQDGGDRRRAGAVLSAMSHQARFLGNFREAITLAQAAQAGIARVATPTLLAQFQSMEARGLAGAGDRSGAEAALARSARSLEAQRLEVEPEWITYFDASEHANEAGHCFRDLAQSRAAVLHASSVVSGHVRSDFFATMVLADAHLGAGDVDEACRVALEALDFGEQLKSARAVSYLRDFRKNLAPHGQAAPVRDLSEQSAENRLWTRSG
jgi:tetratricopeptide (TPR) repeat protein